MELSNFDQNVHSAFSHPHAYKTLIKSKQLRCHDWADIVLAAAERRNEEWRISIVFRVSSIEQTAEPTVFYSLVV